MNNIAIYADYSVDQSIIDQIKKYYLGEDRENMLFVVHDNVIQNSPINDTPCVNAWYLDWYTGRVVFTDVQHFNKKKHLLNTSDVVLFIKKEDLPKLSKDIVGNCSILIQDKTKIRKAKNAELQRFK